MAVAIPHPNEAAEEAFQRLKLEYLKVLAIAVSGGGDSMALMALLSEWLRNRDVELSIVSVNHGLRAEAFDECNRVAEFSHNFGLKHKTITLDPDKWSGNLQAAARYWRYKALGDWAKSQNINTIALGHTLSDQAETVLINLSRASGVDGLSAMPEKLCNDGINWVRPLLGLSRATLRNYLKDKGISWVEDPTNQLQDQARIRARTWLMTTNELGVTANKLALTAKHMQRTRKVLEHMTRKALNRIVSVNNAGEYALCPEFWNLHEEIQLRLFAGLIQFANNETYRRRYSALMNCINSVHNNGIATISRSIVMKRPDNSVVIVRDIHRIECICPTRGLWDNRWEMRCRDNVMEGFIGPLGLDGLSVISKKIRCKYTDRGLAASPVLWKNGEIKAACVDDLGTGIRFIDRCGMEELTQFFDSY